MTIKKIIPSEHQEQSAIIQWAKVNEHVYPQLSVLYAVPNASKRSIGNAQYCKSEGLRSGVPDLCLPIKNKDYGCLYIEMKRSDRRTQKSAVTVEQQEFINNLNKFGAKAVVCYSFDEARDVILEYLGNINQHECALLGKILNYS